MTAMRTLARSELLPTITSSITLAVILHLCSPVNPSTAIYRVWIPIVSVASLPLAHRAKRAPGLAPSTVDEDVDLGSGIRAKGADGVEGGKAEHDRSHAGLRPSSVAHECSRWKSLAMMGISLGAGTVLLVAAAAMGRTLEVICVIALAAPLLHMFPSDRSTGPSSSDPTPIILLALISTLLYLDDTVSSPTPTIGISSRLSHVFGRMTSAGPAGLASATTLVVWRVWGPRWISSRALEAKGEGDSMGFPDVEGCRGCEGRVAGIAFATALFLSVGLFHVRPPTLHSIPLIILAGTFFAYSPPGVILQPSKPIRGDAGLAAHGDHIFLELPGATAMLAILNRNDAGCTVQAIIFGIGLLITHLVQAAQLDQSAVLPASSILKGFRSSDGENETPSPNKRRIYLVLACLPGVLWAVRRLHIAGYAGAGAGIPTGVKTFGVRADSWRAEADYELAISYYNEPRTSLTETIRHVKSNLPYGSISRTTVYFKGPETLATNAIEEMDGLMREVGADAAIALENRGREGETYLQHIVRSYASPDVPLAQHTIFLQPHIAWDWVANPRLTRLRPELGFVSFGPYLNATCFADGNERDSHGMSFGRIPQIYSAFNGDLCPPTGFAITWAGQFLVSRKRILSTPLATYQNLLEYFDIPKGENHPKDWIWSEGWWNSQPSDPSHGHWLERSWPAIFHCSRPELAWDCGEGSGPECECLDV